MRPGGGTLRRGERATAGPGRALRKEKEKLASWAESGCSVGFWPKAR
jgi:hypothetical protein